MISPTRGPVTFLRTLTLCQENTGDGLQSVENEGVLSIMTGERRAIRYLEAGLAGLLLVSITGVGKTAPGSFPTVINQAMAVVAKITAVPLKAPTWAPNVGPSGTPIASFGHVTATTSESKTAYRVNLYYTSKTLPVNYRFIWKYTNINNSGGDYWFGGSRYSSIAGAQVAVRKNVYFWKVPKRTIPVTLRSGVRAKFWYRGPERQEQSTMAWHVNGWSVELLASGFPKSVAVSSAKGLTATVPRCPSPDGTIAVEVAPDHTLVSAMWRTGRVTETVGSVIGSTPVVDLIPSLRLWTAPSA